MFDIKVTTESGSVYRLRDICDQDTGIRRMVADNGLEALDYVEPLTIAVGQSMRIFGTSARRGCEWSWQTTPVTSVQVETS